MVCVRGLLDRVVERRVRGTAEVSVAVEATAVWSRLFLYLDIRARGYVSTVSAQGHNTTSHNIQLYVALRADLQDATVRDMRAR